MKNQQTKSKLKPRPHKYYHNFLPILYYQKAQVNATTKKMSTLSGLLANESKKAILQHFENYY
jgi:hypothetical protein